MIVASAPKLSLRTMVPPFELPSAGGGTISIWDYKGLHHLMIAFLPGGDCPECIEFLRAVSDEYPQYEEENTVVLAAIRDTESRANALHDQLQPPFPVLYGETGVVSDRYASSLPAVFVADKFGELYAQWIVGPGGSFPSQKEILDVLDLINLECPECGARLDWT